MAEVIFSKKQITPIMEKYKIDESNKTFKSVITLFNNQTNYQIWALKLIFDGKVDFQTIENIAHWAEANQTLIQSLSKGNIVSYKNTTEINALMKEMRNLDKIAAVNTTINKFNTAQRGMLRHVVEGITSTNASSNAAFNRLFDVFKKLEAMPKDKKNKIISLSSALTEVNALIHYLNESIAKSYDWNHDDMIAFMHNNADDCEIVHDKNGVVVITVPSFSSSTKMCGGGRTAWCITREERYFNQYVKDHSSNRQFMLFDFNKKESHELAHIGFTVTSGSGISYAHSTKNQSLLGGGATIDGKRIDIHKALEMAGVGKDVYVRLNKLKGYTWSIDALVKFIEANNSHYSICYNKDGRVIVNILDNFGVANICNHTLVPNNAFSTDNGKIYVIFDFNLEVNKELSTITMFYAKDQYGSVSLNTIRDAYNVDITKNGVLEKLGIATKDFLNREAIPPQILLHKLINEGNEKEAMELIDETGEGLDVNHVFNGNMPIFNALDHGMYKLFAKLVGHSKFDTTSCDGVGETLLTSLLYNYMVDGSNDTENKTIKTMIDAILSNDKFDFNAQNCNLDTAINVAAGNPNLLWVVEALVANPNVNLNTENDFGCAALGEAVRHKNIAAIKLLGTRQDLVVTDNDMQWAERVGIDLQSELGVTTKLTVKKVNRSASADLYSELFARVLSRTNR